MRREQAYFDFVALAIMAGAVLIAVAVASKCREFDELRTQQMTLETEVARDRVALDALAADVWAAVEELQAHAITAREAQP